LELSLNPIPYMEATTRYSAQLVIGPRPCHYSVYRFQTSISCMHAIYVCMAWLSYSLCMDIVYRGLHGA